MIRRAALAAAVLGALVVPTAGARGSSCANANTRPGHATTAAIRKAVLCLVNRQRTSRHLPPLR